MARTSRSNPDDGSRSVISRSERYQLLEKKRSIDATPPRIVTKVVEHKKLDTTINDDVTSPLSTASLATSSKAIPRMLEWARMKELLEPTIEHDDEDDNYGGGEFNDVSAVAVAAVDVAMAAAASKSTIDDDNYHSNDDGDEGSGSSGKCNDKNYEDDDDGGGKCSPAGKGLYYSDDDDFLDDIFDDDYIEKHFSSISDEPACDRNRNRIMGGPQPPDPNATEEEKKSYEIKRKAFTDANRRKIMAALSSVNMNVLPQKDVRTDQSGDQFPHIRLMTVVENSRLMTGHTFAKKDTMMIRIGEEANLRNIRVKVLKSCKMTYEVAGDSFYVKVSNLLLQGWTIRSLCCRDNDDTLIIPTRVMYINEKSLRSPFTGEWLGHLLRLHLETCPGMSYVHMRGLLTNYVNTELISDNLLQEARDWAKLQLFGTADINVQYYEAVRAAIIAMGHSCELLFCHRRDVIRQLRATVVREEL